MITNFQMFENDADLSAITGLTRDGLWDNGFDLDDYDWGFVSDEKYFDEYFDKEYEIREFSVNNDVPSYVDSILNWMSNYCVGFKATEYNGRYYYMLYHS